DVGRRGQRRPEYVRDGGVVGAERLLGGNRYARRDDTRVRESVSALVRFDEVRDPKVRSVARYRLGARQVQITKTALGKMCVAHRIEGRAEHDAQPPRLRLDEREDRDPAGDLMREQLSR